MNSKIKTFLLLLILNVISIRFSDAQNLVPNPSFEDTVMCPVGLIQLNYAIGWESYRNSPDLYHSCSTTGTNVPNAVFGYQNAHSGVSMVGIATYRRPNSPNGPNYREYMGCLLNTPLISGTKYFISFYANFSYQPNIAIASNNIGIKLSTIPFDVVNPAPIDNQSHLNYSTILTDSLNWTQISGSFIADSTYNFLIVGNFYSDQNTDTLILSPFPDNAYYYIDDICLSTDSNYCETWTSIPSSNIIKEQFNIYPNPFSDHINIESNSSGEVCRVYNIYGELIEERRKVGNIISLNLENYFSGIYIIKLISDNHSVYKTIVKTL